LEVPGRFEQSGADLFGFLPAMSVHLRERHLEAAV